jgi:flagellin
MKISTNVASLNSQRSFTANRRDVEKSLSQLASGQRINKAADDAAGLAVSKDMEMYLKSAGQANRNTNDAISLIQIADGSFNEINNMMVRLRELGITAASDTVSDSERGMVNEEVRQLKAEMDRISRTTQWTSQKLLSRDDGSYEFQVGIFADKADNQIKVDYNDLDIRNATTGMDGVDFSSKEGAQQGLAQLDNAMTTLGGRRATIGALQNRLNSSLDNLGVQSENLAAAKSRIADADIAEATSAVVRGDIITKAGAATLAQANQSQYVALKLL